MKEIKQYQCELCGHIYETEQEAEECEARHCKIKRLLKADYADWKKTPYVIYVEMEDGRTMCYQDGYEYKEEDGETFVRQA